MEKLLVLNMFSTMHIIYLLVAIILPVVLILVLRLIPDKARKYCKIGIISVMLLFVVLDFVGRLIAKQGIFDSLPVDSFHLFVYISLFVTITNKNSWIKFAYFIILPLSVLALFFPPKNICDIGEANLSIISYFLINSLLIAYSIINIFWEDIYLYKKDILNSTINYIIIVASFHLINVFFRFTTIAVHSNYFGTMGEEYNTLVNFLYSLIPVPLAQLLPLFAVLVGVEFLLLLPFELVRNKKDRNAQYEEIVALGNLKAQQKLRENAKKHSESQILVNSSEKAKPNKPKNTNNTPKGGFVSVNKQVEVNYDVKKDK